MIKLIKNFLKIGKKKEKKFNIFFLKLIINN